MADYVTDTQALVKFMMGKKVINNKAHQAFLFADKGVCDKKVGIVDKSEKKPYDLNANKQSEYRGNYGYMH